MDDFKEIYSFYSIETQQVFVLFNRELIDPIGSKSRVKIIIKTAKVNLNNKGN